MSGAGTTFPTTDSNLKATLEVCLDHVTKNILVDDLRTEAPAPDTAEFLAKSRRALEYVKAIHRLGVRSQSSSCFFRRLLQPR